RSCRRDGYRSDSHARDLCRITRARAYTPPRERGGRRQPHGGCHPSPRPAADSPQRDRQHRCREDVPANLTPAGADLFPPPVAMEAPHEHVVAVAPLGGDRLPPWSGGDGVAHDTAPSRQVPAGPLGSQRQVGVFPVGAAESFVETAEELQCGPAVGDVGGDPGGIRQPGDVPFPVGGTAPSRQWHYDSSLARGGRRTQRFQVSDERRRPSGRWLDVVVEEGDPLGSGGSPSDVAGGCRAAPTAGRQQSHGDPAGSQGGRLAAPVVHHDRVEALEGAQECRQRAPPDRGHHHRDRWGHGPSIPRRRTRYGPRATASRADAARHSRACRGWSTIGCPAMLKEVLTIMGMPVRASKAERQRWRRGRSSASTGWMRAVPATWTTAGILSRQTGATSWVNNMNGLGIGPPRKTSGARSIVTSGAMGRNRSRPLMRLSRSVFAAWPGWASRLRWPRARGPNSARPWNQPTTPSSATISATAAAMSVGSSYGTSTSSRTSRISAFVHARPRAADAIGWMASPSRWATQ